MSNDLFGPAESVAQHIRMIDADVSIIRGFIPEDERIALFERLRADSQWKEEDIVIWGKRMKQPRLIYWVGDPGAIYKYSGKFYVPNPWTPDLQSLRLLLKARFSLSFNSVLLNLYRDEKDSMGWHSDDEPELGSEPTIASISLGEQRDFLMKHKTRRDIKPMRIALPSGSLLVMRGGTQKNWKHSIAKETLGCGPRINLTFRAILKGRSNSDSSP